VKSGEEPRFDVAARVGTTLAGRWKLLRVLGVGGMAAVYEAEHKNKSRCAVKVLHPEPSCHEHLRERFLREGYVANSIDHPGVVKVHDDGGAEGGACFLVMELLRGVTVSEQAERSGGRLPPGEALAIVAQALDAVVAAHAAGIVHRDLKPSNLFLTRQGVVKLVDFGIARMREPGAPAITATGDLLGTPAFMAPEQARGRWDEVDAQTDVWAAGATLFTLLTGQRVHVAETAPEALVKAVCDRARPLAEVDPTQHPEVCALVDCALDPDKESRFASAAAMRVALAEAYAATSGHPLGDAPPLVPREEATAAEPAVAVPITTTSHDAPASQTLTATVRGGAAQPDGPVMGAKPRWPRLAPIAAAGAAALFATAWWAGTPAPAPFAARHMVAPQELDRLVPAPPPASPPAPPAASSSAPAPPVPPSLGGRFPPTPAPPPSASPSPSTSTSADPYQRRR
jgi:serine/threonine protein kinase